MKWVVESALKTKYQENWIPNVDLVHQALVQKFHEVIFSHVAYMVKVAEDDIRKMKERMCRHGNRDKENNTIRKDSINPQFHVVRLLIIQATLINLKSNVADTRRSSLKSCITSSMAY